MLQTHHYLDQRTTVFDKNPKWRDSWADDIDLGILPCTLDEMDYQARGYHSSYALDRTVPPELQSLDSQRRLHHSPINGPTAWSSHFSGPNGHYASSQPPYFENYPRPVPSILKIPENGRHARSWPGGNTEIDASSTLSSMSPKTPVAKSEVDVSVVSPWTAPASSVSHHQAHFADFKQEARYPHEGGAGVSLQQIHPDDPNSPMALRGLQGTPLQGRHPYPRGHFQPELDHPNAVNGYQYHQGTVSPSVLRSPMEQSMADEEDEPDMLMEDDAPGDDDPDYNPNNSAALPTTSRPATQRPRTRGRQAKPRQPTLLSPQTQNNRIKKHTTHNSQPLSNVGTHFSPLPSSAPGPNTHCPHCHNLFSSTATLHKHIQTKHTRPFSCIFRRYSCTQTFGSKNEWARHIRVQHLRLEGWRCDVGKCAPTHGRGHADADEDGRHSFDRKDLFTQHLRRMHRELYTKAALAPWNGNRNGMEANVQDRCYVRLRNTPQGARCPYCPSSSDDSDITTPLAQGGAAPEPAPHVFDTWESFLEHVARHLEKNASDHGNDGEEDTGLRQWLLDQELLNEVNTGWGGDGGWKVVGCEGKKNNSAATTTGGGVQRVGANTGGNGGGNGGRKGRKKRAVKEEDDDGDFEYE